MNHYGRLRAFYPFMCEWCKGTGWTPRHIKRSFCSVDCFKRSREKVELKCSFCGISIKKRKSQLKNSKSGLYFCNRSCKEKAQAIYGGIKEIQPSHYKDGISCYRARLANLVDVKCLRCGYDKEKRMIDVDHIDGNRRNNDPSNLQFLCVWCHALKTRQISAAIAQLVEHQPCKLDVAGAIPAGGSIKFDFTI